MKKELRKIMSDDLVSRSQISIALKLYSDLEKVLDSYNGFTFFALAEALENSSNLDARTDALWSMARAGFKARSEMI